MAEAETAATQARGVDGVIQTGSSTATSGSMRLPQQQTNLVYPRRFQASSPSLREEGQSSRCQSFERQLGMPQHENENASEVLKSAPGPFQWELRPVAPRSMVPVPRPKVSPAPSKKVAVPQPTVSPPSRKIVVHQPAVSPPSKKIVVRQSTVSPSKKSTGQLPLTMQPGASERKINLPKSLGPLMPSPAIRVDQNLQNRQDLFSRPPGFPLPHPKMTAENARVSAAQISGVQVQKQPVANESSAFGNTDTWTDVSTLLQPPPKVEMQPIMTAERKANASNGIAQASGDHVQKQPDTKAMVVNESSHFGKTWTDASMQFQLTPEKLQPVIGNGISPILPPLSWDPKQRFENVFTAEPLGNSPMRLPWSWDPGQGIENAFTAEPIGKAVIGEKQQGQVEFTKGIENVFTAEPIGKGVNGEEQQGQLEFTKQQRDALQAFQRLKRSIGTLPQESAHRATMSLREMEKHLMWLIQNASPDGKVGKKNVQEYVPNTDLGQNASESIITSVEKGQTLKKKEIEDENAVTSRVNAMSKAEAMEEEEQQTLKKEAVGSESGGTSIVDAQSEAEAMEDEEQTPKKEEVGDESGAATCVVYVQSEAEAMEEATPVVCIHEEEQQQESVESSNKGNPEAQSVVSSIDGSDEMQEWVLV